MTEARQPAIRTDIPHSARIWNRRLGGKDNYEIDRTVGDASAAIDPEIRRLLVSRDGATDSDAYVRLCHECTESGGVARKP